MITLGFDIGGTKVAYGTVVDGRLIDTTQVPVPTGDYGALIALIAETVRGSGTSVDAVGVGVAAWMSADREVVHRSASLGWDDMPLRADLARAIDLPVTVVNDADAAAWGAHVLRGHPAGTSMTLTLGTDVGGGVIVNGLLITGSHGIAGELGHLIVSTQGRECRCGGTDCLATVASGTALINHVRALAAARPGDFPALLQSTDPSNLGPADVARASEAECAVLLAEAATGIAAASAIVSRVVDHDTLVLAGGVSAIGDPLRQAVLAALQATPRIGNIHPIPEVYLIPANVPVGVLGAADLATRS